MSEQLKTIVWLSVRYHKSGQYVLCWSSAVMAPLPRKAIDHRYLKKSMIAQVLLCARYLHCLFQRPLCCGH
jgi:hypothetical protein